MLTNFRLTLCLFQNREKIPIKAECDTFETNVAGSVLFSLFIDCRGRWFCRWCPDIKL
jgi:hypothetical protein